MPPGQEAADAVPLPREKRVETEPGAPESLEVPSLGIAAPIIPIGAPGGVLTPPSDPQTLGWWADGAKPALASARPSSPVTPSTPVVERWMTSSGSTTVTACWMTTDRGRIGYDVNNVVVLGKGELAERAGRIFDQEVPGRLVLITCEDWNGVEYLSNVVVTATPAVA